VELIKYREIPFTYRLLCLLNVNWKQNTIPGTWLKAHVM